MNEFSHVQASPALTRSSSHVSLPLGAFRSLLSVPYKTPCPGAPLTTANACQIVLVVSQECPRLRSESALRPHHTVTGIQEILL